MKIAFSGISRAGGRNRSGAEIRPRHREPAAGGAPALVQFGDERLGTAVDARTDADLLEKCEQALVFCRVVVGEHFGEVARIGQPLALGHAQEQPRQPVRKVAADQKKMAVLELMKQPFRRQVLGLKRTDELEKILVGQHIRRRSRQAAEQMVDDMRVATARVRSEGRRRGLAHTRRPRSSAARRNARD